VHPRSSCVFILRTQEVAPIIDLPRVAVNTLRRQLTEICSKGKPGAGVAQTWRELQKRRQHKLPFLDARVRQDEIPSAQHMLAEEENINIEGSRPFLPLPLPVPPHSPLDPLHAFEKRGGGPPRPTEENEIEKPGLCGFVERLGFVQTGDSITAQTAPESFGRSEQRPLPITQIRSQGEVNLDLPQGVQNSSSSSPALASFPDEDTVVFSDASLAACSPADGDSFPPDGWGRMILLTCVSI